MPKTAYPKYDTDWDRKSSDQLTPEQLEAKRKYFRDAMRRHRAKHPESGKDANRVRCRTNYATPKWRAKSLCRSASLRSARRGIPFHLKWQEIQRIIENGRCEVTGIPFDLTPNEDGGPSPYAPSIDQVVPGLGYTPDNIRVVVLIYNLAKGQWSDQIVRGFAQAVVNNVPGLRLTGTQ